MLAIKGDEEMEREERRPVFFERFIPEEQGILGGRTFYELEGGYVKRIHIPFCDVCGRELSRDNRFLCSRCRKKVCAECVTKVEGRYVCLECVERMYPVGGEIGYRILVSIHKGINNLRKLNKLIPEGAEPYLRRLKARGFILEKGLMRRRYCITALGVLAISAFSKFYDDELDPQYL